MSTPLEMPLNSLTGLEIRAEHAEVVTWQGREALRVENGLVLVADSLLADASVEVLVGTDGSAYSGIAFRAADILNYELAYAVPHVSGQWDAIQYDPVFHGSNTWQLYHGPGYQKAAQVPMGEWFRLKMDFSGHRAAVSVNDQDPLVVETLAHAKRAGMLGLWTFQPVYFSQLQVSECTAVEEPPQGESPRVPAEMVEAWFLDGYGVVECEANGVLNLNRFIPVSLEEVRLIRRFRMEQEGPAIFEFGFSDALSLELDGEEMFHGEIKFAGFADRKARGYAEPGAVRAEHLLPAGEHELAAVLGVSEGFGWGLTMFVAGEGLTWLPAKLG